YLLDTALRLRPFFIMLAMVAMLASMVGMVPYQAYQAYQAKDGNQREGGKVAPLVSALEGTKLPTCDGSKILTVGAGISKIDSVAGTRISELADAG
ncbi:2553_t:CDS:2, partial [Racocetra persica]